MGFADQIKAWTDKVKRVLEIAASFEGERWTFAADPKDPASVQAAIAQAEARIDERFAPVADLEEGQKAAAEIKEKAALAIRRAAEAA